MNTQYLTTTIEQSKRTTVPRYGMTADGYTVASGAPTGCMIMLAGEKIWRRLMCWQFSNAGTLFVRINGTPYIVNEWTIPD